MVSDRNVPTVDELHQNLSKEETWLKEFQKCQKQNETINEEVCKRLDNFTQQIDQLRARVAPLCNKTTSIQRKQQNVKKLLGIVEASIQFYGKTVEFESAFRRGTANFSLPEYLERMDGLREAIAFFGRNSAHKGQLDTMRDSFEAGCSFLETEFNNAVRSETIPLDPVKIADCLDENYEIPSTRVSDLKTIKDTSKLALIGRYLHKNTKNRDYLQYYANHRAQNIVKTLRLANDQLRGFAQNKSTRIQFLKTTFRRGKGGERQADDPWGESVMTLTAISFSILMAMVQIETEVVAKIFQNVDVEAQLVRSIASPPLQEVMEKAPINQFDANFVSMIPLVRMLTVHSTQLTALTQNAGQSELYQTFCRNVFSKGAHVINDFIDHLTNEHMRFVPEDGNVHEITSNTMNFLKILAKYQNVVVNVMTRSGKADGSEPVLPKLFSQILAALGVNLKNKSGAYADPSLAALFLFNNFTYINNGLKEDPLKKIARDVKSAQLVSFYEQQITSYLKKYLESWNRVLTVLNDASNSSVKSKYANFNKEFDSVIAAQKHFCVVDIPTAEFIRQRIKDMVLAPYIEFTSKHSQEASNFNLDRQLKYDAESVEIIINRLFDVSY
ncbi:unnamed protein product [Bursaphelenchus xylophilus]|uniref:Exocyst complex component 7 n=1 Tax=Bursaphelenchus xylophilus TaxID=6326 RepID=A0A1I7S0Q7_BURXY|nr:unnamed protein product [Bursaphelenchus xylophilus]CAG9088263.1 unnamed protein product [Bursaphelenchus xylophilus]